MNRIRIALFNNRDDVEAIRDLQRQTGNRAVLGTWKKALCIAGLMLLANRASLPAAQAQERFTKIQKARATAKISVDKTRDRAPNQASADSATPTYLRDVLPIFIGKCASCHNNQARFLYNWFDYKTAVADRWEIRRRVWDSWKGSYFKQPMPIGNSPESDAMTEQEHTIVKNWIDGGAPYGVPPRDGTPQSKPERIERGKQIFGTVCAVCHQPTGQGIPARFPPLVLSDFLNSDKSRAIRIVLNGIQGEIFVNGQKFNNTMPSLPLSDGDIAAALTYVYNSFGNSGKEVKPQEVKALREQKGIVNTRDEENPFE